MQNVVRDLWALRLETFSDRITDPSEGEEGEPELFSSQPLAQADVEDNDESSRPSQNQNRWPRMIDSIGLCYMGALLLRLPVTIADMHQYVCFSSCSCS